jgi:hypothetical protein
MADTSFTPGPWKPGRSEFYPGLDGPMTKRVYTEFPPNEIEVSGDNCRANAYLIAAAPELYEALMQAEAFIAYYAGAKDRTELLPKVSAALRKARGEAE